MALVWMLNGVYAGRFLVKDDEEAKALVDSGHAQYATDSAESMKAPDEVQAGSAQYPTKELRAAKPKAKRKRKVKKEEEPSSDE